jgi:uncharacterized zinc-type alcohol dehydrogenase-like protein
MITSPEKGADASAWAPMKCCCRRCRRDEGARQQLRLPAQHHPVSHDINPYIVLLRDRTMAMVGVLTELDPPASG